MLSILSPLESSYPCFSKCKKIYCAIFCLSGSNFLKFRNISVVFFIVSISSESRCKILFSLPSCGYIRKSICLFNTLGSICSNPQMTFTQCILSFFCLYIEYNSLPILILASFFRLSQIIASLVVLLTIGRLLYSNPKRVHWREYIRKKVNCKFFTIDFSVCYCLI